MLINTRLASNPFNWIKVGLMILLFFVGVKLAGDFVNAARKQANEQ